MIYFYPTLQCIRLVHLAVWICQQSAALLTGARPHWMKELAPVLMPSSQYAKYTKAVATCSMHLLQWHAAPAATCPPQMVGRVIQDKMDKKLRQAAHQSSLLAAVAAQQQQQAAALQSGGVAQPLARSVAVGAGGSSAAQASSLQQMFAGQTQLLLVPQALMTAATAMQQQQQQLAAAAGGVAGAVPGQMPASAAAQFALQGLQGAGVAGGAGPGGYLLGPMPAASAGGSIANSSGPSLTPQGGVQMTQSSVIKD